MTGRDKPTYYECGICSQLHPVEWNGDCREDIARFNPEDLDVLHPEGWEEVDMPGGAAPRAYTYDDLRAEFRVCHSGDLWGCCMSWWFTVADEIYWNRDGIEVPDAWQFKPGADGPCNEPGELETEMVEGATDDALIRFGHLLDRYASALKHAGRSY